MSLPSPDINTSPTIPPADINAALKGKNPIVKTVGLGANKIPGVKLTELEFPGVPGGAGTPQGGGISPEDNVPPMSIRRNTTTFTGVPGGAGTPQGGGISPEDQRVPLSLRSQKPGADQAPTGQGPVNSK